LAGLIQVKIESGLSQVPGVIGDQWHFSLHQLLDVRHELSLVRFIHKRPSNA
jgi:hypothetical protein